ncbi:sensor histidine kinase [Cellulomonas sp.]|uniref:sensor histidine kinase n=1 Tax=Cellulomonas sp. TaxID=40001 RepID=UPI002D349A73|nr:histidine kinase [Cellulomonas sp.]HYQ74057.1 histidine kinase [Cellulomonas sp.]
MPLRRPARWPRLDDRGVALVYLGVGLLLLGLGVSSTAPATDGPAADALHAGLLLAGCAALAAKRRHPRAVLLVATAAFAGSLVVGGSLGLLLVLWDALYTAAVVAPARTRRVLVAVVAVLTAGAAVAGGVLGDGLRDAVQALLFAAALLVTPLWWAADVRSRTEIAAFEARRAELERQRADLARAHAADVERIADLDRDAAVRGERAAMARDLHDVVASRLSAIAIHAEAALADAPDPGRDRTALRAVRAEAVASLDEMRAMVLVLRGADEDAPVRAAAGLDRLGDLVAAARAHGLDVRATAPDRPALPAVVDQAAYRIAGEALANAAAHGPAGGRVDVRVTAAGGALEIEVANALPAGPGPGAPADARPGLRSATGLLTMRERARSIGGDVVAGPEGGEWRVRAVLPLAAATAPGGAGAAPRGAGAAR